MSSAFLIKDGVSINVDDVTKRRRPSIPSLVTATRPSATCATDQGGLETIDTVTAQAFTINVDDVNEGPIGGLAFQHHYR